MHASRWQTAIGILSIVLSGVMPAGSEPELWLYYSTNLLVDERVAALERVWQRASAAGYRRVILTDSKFARLRALGDSAAKYRANVERVKQIAARCHLQVMPAVFPLGWANDLLSNDPNLAEGLPVSNALFVVRGGVATLVPDPPVFLGDPSWKDGTVAMADGTATVNSFEGNARFAYRLTLPRNRVYHVAVKIRTESFTGTPEIKALAGDRMLQYQGLGVRPTQDWTEHHVVFNTQGNESVGLYFGVWGGGKGRLQWKDWRLQEAGLVNVLRRTGAPFRVCSEDGRTVYREGTDFDRVVDPRLGREPYAGEYRCWHEPVGIRTALPEGTRLRVSWHHPVIVYEGAVMACVSDAGTVRLLAEQAHDVRELWGASAYMMGHDEIRAMNQDASCRQRNMDAGAILADNARACRRLLAGAEVAVWSDMFDPFHNARKDYYLVRGDLDGSWEGLDPSVLIVNWNLGRRDESLKFFSRRGHRQVIAGYYDGNPEDVKLWIASAVRVPGIVAVMYTTWVGRYDDLERFAAICRAYPWPAREPGGG